MDLQTVYSQLDNYFMRRDYPGARKFLGDRIGDAEAEQDLESQMALLSELGGLLRVCAMYSEGIDCFKKSLALADAAGMAGTPEEATVRLNLATLYVAADDVIKAHEEYDRVEEIYAKLGVNDFRLTAYYNNRASLYLKEGVFDEAVRYAENALERLADYPDSHDECGVTGTILTQIYTAERDYGTAEKYARLAEDAFCLDDDINPMHYAALLSAKAQVKYYMEKYDEACGAYKGAMELLERNFGRNLSYLSCLRGLSLCYEMAGNKADAVSCRQEAKLLEEGLLG